MKKYNTPHRRRAIKTRLTEEEYTEFSERVALCKMSQSMLCLWQVWQWQVTFTAPYGLWQPIP